MKIFYLVALLFNLNLYTMECFQKENKPSIHQRCKKQYEKLIPSTKKKKTSGCFDGISNAVSRILTFNSRYLNQ